jgi:hypothetical protein
MLVLLRCVLMLEIIYSNISTTGKFTCNLFTVFNWLRTNQRNRQTKSVFCFYIVTGWDIKTVYVHCGISRYQQFKFGISFMVDTYLAENLIKKRDSQKWTEEWYIFEPLHDKTNIVRLRPAWIQTSLRICAVWSGSMLFTYQLYYMYRNW